MSKKVRHYFPQFTSIRTAILISYSFLVILALSIFLIVSLYYTQNTIVKNSTEYTSQLVEQANADIDSYIQYMKNVSLLIMTNSDVSKYLFDETADENEKNEYYKAIIEQFDTLSKARPDICNIGIYRSKDRYIFNSDNSRLNPNTDLERLDWYINTLNADGRTYLSTSHVQTIVENSYHWVITLSSTLKNPNTDKRDGFFFVDLNYSSIKNLCEQINLGKKGYVFILDADSNIVYHPKQQLIFSNLETECLDKIKELDEGQNSFITTNNGQKMLYTVSTSSSTGWTIVGAAYISELNTNASRTTFIYSLVTIILFIGAFFFSRVISRAITLPILKLQDSMSKVEQGKFDTVIELDSNFNEIDSLSSSFNVMTHEIQSLIAQNIEEQRQKRKSELNALQSQINPHFLYNTLDSIIWMAEMGADKDVVLMTSSLAKLFRQSISNENEIVYIHQEIEYTKSYLTIQKMRYKDTLDFKIEVDSEIMNYCIVKLILQPIVENAIYHGIKFKQNKGTVWINGFMEDNNVILTVSDNGIGMSQEQLQHIFDAKKAGEKHNGVGINNIQNRLRLYYGEGYGLTFESEENAGTTVYICIPAVSAYDADGFN